MYKKSPYEDLIFPELSPKNSENIIPIYLANDKDELEMEEIIPDQLTILVEKNIVLFPGITIPFIPQNKTILQILQNAYKEGHSIGMITKKPASIEIKKNENNFFSIGTTAKIVKMIDLPDGQKAAILCGNKKFSIESIVKTKPILLAKVCVLTEQSLDIKNQKSTLLTQSIRNTSKKVLQSLTDISQEARDAVYQIKNPNLLVNFLSFNLNLEIIIKQRLLELDSLEERGKLLLKYLLDELEMTKLKNKIQNKVHADIYQQQRDFYLRQQIKTLQDELGDTENHIEEIKALQTLGKKKKWPKEVKQHFEKILAKATRTNSHSPEYAVYINHAEILVELPWETYTKENFDLENSIKTLNKNHYGIEKIKERIIEYLAVMQLKQNIKGPILCFYGPPGVGKTSLGKSIAQSLQRKYVKISLGGLHDEAEIRGHRKTYVGAMPGKIIQAIKKAQASNPVIILDEIDKVSNEFRGDPSAALLEVLDPEQNHAFVDNFLEVPYDLSKILFIATANSLDSIPSPLRDRMEVIKINGYTLEEKLQIAKKYLVPKQRKEHGLKVRDISIDNEVLKKIIECYTYEAGVRELSRQLGKISRKIAKNIVLTIEYDRKITCDALSTFLGKEIFDQEIYQHITLPGVAIGLAWTPVGGEILFIESSLSKGKGKLTLSGKLGDVMKESAMIALSYIKAYAATWSIDHHIFEQYDLHIHVPAGAIPKDGPSAGITLLTSLLSLYTQRKVQDNLAMTGEITLRGNVLPVGGIQEKILAAKHTGINTIILSKKNEKDIQAMKKKYTQDLQILYIDKISDIPSLALQQEPVSNTQKWDITNIMTK